MKYVHDPKYSLISFLRIVWAFICTLVESVLIDLSNFRSFVSITRVYAYMHEWLVSVLTFAIYVRLWRGLFPQVEHACPNIKWISLMLQTYFFASLRVCLCALSHRVCTAWLEVRCAPLMSWHTLMHGLKSFNASTTRICTLLTCAEHMHTPSTPMENKHPWVHVCSSVCTWNMFTTLNIL